ncbi:GNAT family N-acetyltransferase [Nocardia otitidiscaviarum]|uniref:GNAT family N-acetyltransferase n=1 Tax=Nocardia otitidiscaviarum TaxID=1823 RepID=UPI0018939368|nr:GNAT family N-acetyltransferase [Nocardia otitidiscaviarum]MBF6176966.1 GNAT family N-acetyltransferase [Nocardia otitidiscaviarum]
MHRHSETRGLAAEVTKGGREDAVAHLDAMVRLYATVFAEPPYRERPDAAERFRRWLTDELDEPGFELVVGIDSRELVGMAYGYRMAAGRWWSDAVEPPPVELSDVPTFAVMEWAVLADYRETGLGRALMDTLLTARTETYASLCANPAATAHDTYLRWGWRAVGRTTPGPTPSMTIMVKHLESESDRRPG